MFSIIKLSLPYVTLTKKVLIWCAILCWGLFILKGYFRNWMLFLHKYLKKGKDEIRLVLNTKKLS